DPLQEMARVVWRCLLDQGEQRLELAKIAIEDGIKLLDAPQRTAAKKAAPDPGLKEARAALKQAERAEKERQAMKEQLAAARAEIALREQRLAEQKLELERLRAEAARL